jgi:hypothetical protein
LEYKHNPSQNRGFRWISQGFLGLEKWVDIKIRAKKKPVLKQTYLYVD